MNKFQIFLIAVFQAIFHLSGYSEPQDNTDIEKLKKELSIAEPDTQKIRLLNELSYSLRKSDTALMRKYAIQALHLSQEISNYTGSASAYINLGEYYRNIGNKDLALEKYFEAVTICIDHNLKPELTKVYNKIGVTYQALADYEQALEYFQKSLPLTKELGDEKATAGLYNNIGIINFLHGEYSKSLENYLASLKIREKIGDKQGIAASYNNIANIFSEQKKLDQALAYYLKGAEIRKELNDLKGLSNTYGNIGSLYYMQGNNSNAMIFYEEAKRINENLKDNDQLALNFLNIGKIFLDEGNHAEAVSNFSAARQIYRKTGDKRGLATTASSIGSLYIKRKNFNLAFIHLEEALELAKEINLKEEIHNIYNKLAEASEIRGDYKKALEYYRLYMSLQDSLVNEASTKMVSELESKYRSGKKQKEIELLKKEKEIQAAVLEKNKITIYSSFALIALVVSLAIIVFRNNRQKQKINSMLLIRNKEIFGQKEEKEVLLKEVHHRVKNNLQVINSLLNIQSAYIDDHRVSSLFVDCQNRIRSMALIHEQLYSSSSLHKVNLNSYIESLARDILRSYNLNYTVTLDFKLSVESFGVNTLIPVGLILNELFSNSLKHAFEEGKKDGKITISLKEIGDGNFELIVGDNGKGIEGDSWNSESSLGLELVETFVNQLDGKIEKLPVQGTVFRIVFRDISSAIIHNKE